MRDEVGARLAGTRIVAMTGYGQQSDRDSTMQGRLRRTPDETGRPGSTTHFATAIGRRDPAP